jgi:hypothetical protein
MERAIACLVRGDGGASFPLSIHVTVKVVLGTNFLIEFGDVDSGEGTVIAHATSLEVTGL